MLTLRGERYHDDRSMTATSHHKSERYRDIQRRVERAYDHASSSLDKDAVDAVRQTIDLLDEGVLRVATHEEGGWRVHQWVKKAILLSFTIEESRVLSFGHDLRGGGVAGQWFDKVPLKTSGWDEATWRRHGFRAVPGSIIRRGAYIGRQAVLMPCFINIGAYVGTGTMVDTWATVGSCAHIGNNCHISGGAGIGGVLEPLQATPVIIEDDCFIGARCEIAEGVRVGQGSVLAMGVYLGASTKIVDRTTGDITYGEVPPYSVIVPGSLPAPHASTDDVRLPSLNVAVIVKKVDAQTRRKTSLNALLRES